MITPVLVDGVPVDYSGLPYWLRDDMKLYIEQGTRSGHFLHNVLCNHLIGTVLNCQSNRISDLPEICRWLINNAPPDCFGYEDLVWAWMDKFRNEA